MTFADFRSKVEQASLNAFDRGNGHWQVLGGAKTVNCWPFAKSGPKMQVDGESSVPLRGRNEFAAQVIGAAGKPAKSSAASRPGSLRLDDLVVRFMEALLSNPALANETVGDLAADAVASAEAVLAAIQERE